MKNAWDVLEDAITRNGARKTETVNLTINTPNGSSQATAHFSTPDYYRFLGGMLATTRFVEEGVKGEWDYYFFNFETTDYHIRVQPFQ